MYIRSLHRVVTVNEDLHPGPLVFEPTAATGYFEGEVPDAVGEHLLAVSPGDFTKVETVIVQPLDEKPPDVQPLDEKPSEALEADPIFEKKSRRGR